MAESSGSHRCPPWVTFADALTIALLGLAAAVFVTGGARREIAGLFVSLTSSRRLVAWALLVAAVRHAACRRPTLFGRLHAVMAWLWRRVPLGLGPPLADDGAVEAIGRPPVNRTTKRELAVVVVAFVCLTIVMTYPQVRILDGLADLGDPLFSVWRLAWTAHQLGHDPLHLFDANILYPARFTLAYSDSLLLPDFAAAPLVWLGVRPIVVHGLLLMSSFVLAGVFMYLFVRSVTGQPPAGLVAGVAFAFYPYRFDHYCHFEQLFSFWMPLALWALHRTTTGGRVRDGLLLGGAVGAQYLSGMYLGAFLALWMVPVAAALAIGRGAVRSSIKALLAAAVFAAVLVAPTLPPHFAARQAVGERSAEEVTSMSPRADRYLVAASTRVVYQKTLGRRRHEGEKDLFPGIVVVALALVAVWPPLSAARIAYAIGLVFAFEASLGMNGYLYPLLYKFLVPVRAFRVPGRFSMLVGLSLVVLAGYAVARLTSGWRRPAYKYFVAVGLSAALVCESWSVVWLEVPPQPSAVYRWFQGRPPSVVTALPVPAEGTPLQFVDCTYMYFSTGHWQRMTNGYSGAWPRSYGPFREAMTRFPDDTALQALRSNSVRYVVVHEAFYGHLPYRRVIEGIGQRTDLEEVARAREGRAETRIYEVVASR